MARQCLIFSVTTTLSQRIQRKLQGPDRPRPSSILRIFSAEINMPLHVRFGSNSEVSVNLRDISFLPPIAEMKLGSFGVASAIRCWTPVGTNIIGRGPPLNEFRQIRRAVSALSSLPKI